MKQVVLTPHVGILRRFWGHFIATLTTLFLFSALLGVNVVQVSAVVIWPFSRPLFRKINRGCAFAWWSTCVFVQEIVYGIRPIFTGDVIPEKESAFLLVNHQSMSDILSLFSFALRKKRLSHMRFFVKDALKYIPGLGWGMKFLEFPFLSRNWEMDQVQIHKMFRVYIEEKLPLWMVSFVEGTRIRQKKWEKSCEYAAKHGLPRLENLLLPRTKGFVAVVQNLREQLNAVYDVTICYPKGIPSLWQVVSGYVGEFTIHVRRFQMKDLPKSAPELSQWLIERFIEKDQILANQLFSQTV